MGHNNKTSSSSNRKILLLPILIILITLGFYKNSIDSDDNSVVLRSPASIAVAGSLKTILVVSESDYDVITTEKIQSDLAKNITPQQLQQCSQQLVEKIKNEKMRFYLFKVFNSVGSSQDQVEISIDGRVYGHVILSNAETALPIPLEFGKSKLITVRAIQTSEAGITFGAKLKNSDVLLKNLGTSESEKIYIGFDEANPI